MGSNVSLSCIWHNYVAVCTDEALRGGTWWQRDKHSLRRLALISSLSALQVISINQGNLEDDLCSFPVEFYNVRTHDRWRGEKTRAEEGDGDEGEEETREER